MRAKMPDGRFLVVNMIDREGPDRGDLRGQWEVWVEGRATHAIVGSPLAGTIADLLGYNTAHDEWPTWIDDLTREIEAEFGVDTG